jgi:TolB protein
VRGFLSSVALVVTLLVLAACGSSGGISNAPCAASAARTSGQRASLSFVRGVSMMLSSSDGSHVSTLLRGRAQPRRGRGDEDIHWYVQPAWSPNGRCLAYTSGGYPTEGTWVETVEVMRGTSSLGRKQAGPQGTSWAPAWAPDGRYVVLVGAVSEFGGGLYIEGVGSHTEIQLTRISEAPDGKTIAFTRLKRGKPSLYLIRADGTGQRRLTTTTAANPSWSPDGKWIAFDDRRRIAVIGADGRGLRYLTNAAGADVDPAWSPDGHTIAFVRRRSAQSKSGDIWAMSPTGSDQRLLVRNGNEPAWKP